MPDLTKQLYNNTTLIEGEKFGKIKIYEQRTNEKEIEYRSWKL
jgi:hypothetical protein